MINAVESVTIGESFALAGVSMGIIIGVLAAIMVLIYLMSGAFKLMEKYNPALKAKLDSLFKKKGEEASVPTPETKKDAPTAPGSCGELVLKKVKDREAALIMAIVADQMQTPLNELRFKSISLVEDEQKAE